jgi:hypothetical protein
VNLAAPRLMTLWRSSLARLSFLKSWASPAEIALIWTIVVLLTSLEERAGRGRLVVMALAAPGLLSHWLRRSSVWWASITIVIFATYWPIWPLVDNHQWLLVYWCLAIACSLTNRVPEVSLALTARLLVGLCFGLAAAWKTLQPGFRDGSFFEFSLVADHHLRPLGHLMGLISQDQVGDVERGLAELTGCDGARPYQSYSPSAGLRTASVVLTWWTIGIEAMISLSFLARANRFVILSRHICMLAFLFTTYATTPIRAFSWILVALSVATLPRNSRLLPMYGLALAVPVTIGKLLQELGN